MGIGGDPEDGTVVGLPILSGDPLIIPTCRGRSWRDSGASWVRVSLVECALNDRPASGWVFPTRTLEDHGSAVLVASVTLIEASALLCGWERAPRPFPVKGKHT